MTRQLSIEEKVDALLERIDNLEREVTRLETENKALKKEVHQLKTRLAKYETPKNSTNSSRPPSSDFPKPRRTNSLRESSGKKPGGQIGHEGTTLRMCSSPDFIEKHAPTFCTCCGEDLTPLSGLFSGKRQIIDIPPISPIITEHQLFDKRCNCGHLNKASFPAGATASVSYGENIQALTAYLSTRQYLPIKRLSEFLSDMFSLSISTGGICYILNKMQSKASVVYESIRQNVLKHKVIGADETGVNIDGKNNWAWTFQHESATFIGIHPSRGFKAVEKLMPEGFRNNVLVTDCWSTYFKTNAQSHQLCTAHLLRELKFLKDRYKTDSWATRMSKIISDALELHRENKKTKTDIDKILSEFSELITETISTEAVEMITFQKRMVKYSDYVFNFLTNNDIPPDNNGSERAIRNFKIKLKISGFFKSIEGAQAYATIRSIIDTAIKNKKNPFEIIKLIAQCEIGTE